MKHDDVLENDTGLKLKEAEILLEEIKSVYSIFIIDDSAANFIALKTKFSAFLSAGRSITFYMQRQYAKIPGFSEWYTIKQQDMSKDQELNYFNKARVETIHIAPVRLGMENEVSCGIVCSVVSPEEAIRRREILGNIESTEIQDTTPTTPPTRIKTVNLFLPRQAILDGKLVKMDRDMNLIEFCEKQLDKLKNVVRECENTFFQ